MINGNQMDAHRMNDLTVVHLFQYFFNYGHALLICYKPRTTLIRHCLPWYCGFSIFEKAFALTDVGQHSFHCSIDKLQD